MVHGVVLFTMPRDKAIFQSARPELALSRVCSRFCCFPTANGLSKENNGRETDPVHAKKSRGLYFFYQRFSKRGRIAACPNTHLSIFLEETSLLAPWPAPEHLAW